MQMGEFTPRDPLYCYPCITLLMAPSTRPPANDMYQLRVSIHPAWILSLALVLVLERRYTTHRKKKKRNKPTSEDSEKTLSWNWY